MASKDGKTDADDIGWAWALAGTALFAIAIAAPLVVVNLSESLRDAPELAQSEEVENVETAARDAEDALKTDPSLESGFATATIVPGVGMGKVSLGQPVASVLDRLTERFQAHFDHDEKGVIQHHSFFLSGAEVRLDSRPDQGRIEAIRLGAASCTELEESQPRQEGLPVTADGLTIGSHQSRVIRRLGVPIKGLPLAPIPGPMRQPKLQVFDGITFEYCPNSQLVRAVSVNRSNDLQHEVDLVATAQPNAQAPSPTLPMAVAETARLTDGIAATRATRPATKAPLQATAPVLDPGQLQAPQRPSIAWTETPSDLSREFSGLDTASMIAMAPVADLPVRPHRPAESVKSLVAVAETDPVDRTQTYALRTPDALDQAANVLPRTDNGTRYETEAASLALPVFSGVGDRGLLTPRAETNPPLIAHAPNRPLDLASPGTGGQPSALASVDSGGDQISPLAEVKPGASLPVTRTHGKASLPPVRAADVSRPVYQASAEQQLAFAPMDQLVDPGGAPSAVIHLAGPPVMVAELAEASLGLNRSTRRKLQRKLSLIGYDPAGIDGIFGPKTRIAIAALQADADLEPTGFLDAEVKELIEARSRKPYANWQRAVKKRRAEQRAAATKAAPVKVARIPEVKRIPKCKRGEDGLITSNQSFSCDVDLLQESLQDLFNFNS